MKRLIITTALISMALTACAEAYAGDTAVPVYVDNRKVKLDPPAIMRDGKAYVGLRSIAKMLGATVKWNDKTKTAIVTAGNKRTKIAQSQAITIDGVLFLPLRLTSEALGCTVKWDSSARAVKVTKEPPCPRGGG